MNVTDTTHQQFSIFQPSSDCHAVSHKNSHVAAQPQIHSDTNSFIHHVPTQPQIHSDTHMAISMCELTNIGVSNCRHKSRAARLLTPLSSMIQLYPLTQSFCNSTTLQLQENIVFFPVSAPCDPSRSICVSTLRSLNIGTLPLPSHYVETVLPSM